MIFFEGRPRAVPGVSTGFPELDGLLGGGWPLGVLIEVLIDTPGSRELGLLAPAMAALTRGAGVQPWVLLIAPPHIPYAPGLSQRGVELSGVLVASARRHNDVLWSMEEALGTGACAAVVAWAGPTGRSALRRLHLAARKGRSWAVLVRPTRCRAERSPALLRLQLDASRGDLEVFKNRFGQAGRASLANLE